MFLLLYPLTYQKTEKPRQDDPHAVFHGDTAEKQFSDDPNGNKNSPRDSLGLFGDPYGTRTHVTAVKGRCLNHLTNGP